MLSNKYLKYTLKGATMEFLKAIFKPDFISIVILITCVVNVLVYLTVLKNISRFESTV